MAEPSHPPATLPLQNNRYPQTYISHNIPLEQIKINNLVFIAFNGTCRTVILEFYVVDKQKIYIANINYFIRNYDTTVN